MSKFAMFMIFFMKIKLNLLEDDIAFHFGVHKTTVSRVFHRILDIIYVKTNPLIKWPDRCTLRSTMPLSFRKFFSIIVKFSWKCQQTYSHELEQLQTQLHHQIFNTQYRIFQNVAVEIRKSWNGQICWIICYLVSNSPLALL